MTNEERDKMIRGTHDAVIGMVKQVKDHEKVLFGNGKPGMVKEVTLLQERQDQCPARKANSTENKKVNIATMAVVLAIITLLVNITLTILSWK